MYDTKLLRSVATNGEISTETLFHYHEQGRLCGLNTGVEVLQEVNQ